MLGLFSPIHTKLKGVLESSHFLWCSHLNFCTYEFSDSLTSCISTLFSFSLSPIKSQTEHTSFYTISPKTVLRRHFVHYFSTTNLISYYTSLFRCPFYCHATRHVSDSLLPTELCVSSFSFFLHLPSNFFLGSNSVSC